MASGYKDFVNGTSLPESDLDDYLGKQVVMVYASAAARTADATLTAALREGMVSFLLDVNTLCVYTGAAWSTVGPAHGAWSAWTPVVTQSGAVSCTVTKGSYMRVGRMIHCDCLLSITGAGTASNFINITLPVAATFPGTLPIGNGYLIDTSVPSFYRGMVALSSGTLAVMYDTSTAASVTAANSLMGSGTNTMNNALAAGDTVAFNATYEASVDA